MEIQELKELATKLGISYHHMLGAEKLEALIAEHCANNLNKSFEEVAKEYGYTTEPKDNDKDKDTDKSKYTPTQSTPEEERIKRLSTLTFDKIDAKNRKKNSHNVNKDALKLVRCIITCNNKNKTSYTGEIFTARNGVIEEVKKFIPFGVPTHVPTILLNMIKEKQYQMFRKEKLPNGNTVTRPYLVPEYNIQELPPLTSEELEAIKRKQLAEGEVNR